MTNPIRRARQFVQSHPVITHSAVAVVALGVGARTAGKQWENAVREQYGQEAVDKFYDMPVE